MSEDELEANDIESIVLTGEIVRKYTNDPRGVRYQVLGNTPDGRKAHVVVSFLIIRRFINYHRF